MVAKKKVVKKKTTNDIPAKSTQKAEVKKAPVKRVAAKKSPASRTAESVLSRSEASFTKTPSNFQNARGMKFNKTLFVPLLIIIVFGLLYVFRGNIFVATVNNQPIWAGTFYNELKKDAGQQAMSDLVTKSLILQEAQRRHVSASDNEINAQIKQLQLQFSLQGQNLTDLLKQKNMTMDDLKDQIKVKLLIQKILGNSVMVSDKEVNDYLNKNKDSLPNGQITDTAKAQARQQLESQKLQDQFQVLVARLQKQAKIHYYISY